MRTSVAALHAAVLGSCWGHAGAIKSERGEVFPTCAKQAVNLTAFVPENVFPAVAYQGLPSMACVPPAEVSAVLTVHTQFDTMTVAAASVAAAVWPGAAGW